MRKVSGTLKLRIRHSIGRDLAHKNAVGEGSTTRKLQNDHHARLTAKERFNFAGYHII